jgi:hypothetical protein
VLVSIDSVNGDPGHFEVPLPLMVEKGKIVHKGNFTDGADSRDPRLTQKRAFH